MISNTSLIRSIRFSIYGIFLIAPFLFSKVFYYGFIVPRATFFMAMVQIVVFLWVLLLVRDQSYRPRKNAVLIGLLVFLVTLIVTALVGYDPAQSFISTHQRMTGIFFVLHMSALAVVIASVFRTRKDWHTLFAVNAIAGVFFSLLLFLGPHGIRAFALFDIREGGATIGNTSFAATYLLFTFWMTLLVALYVKSRTWRILSIAALLLIFFNPMFFNFTIFQGHVSFAKLLSSPTSIIGHGKAATLSLYGGLVLLGLLGVMHRMRKKWVTILGGLLIAAGVFAFVVAGVQLFNEGSAVRSFFVSETSETRLVVWDIAWEGFKHRPLTGVGFENFDLVFQEHFDPILFSDDLNEKNWFDHAHNIILEFLSTTGVLGLLAYIFLITAVFITLFRVYRRRPDLFNEIAIVGVMFLGYLMQNLTAFDTITSYRMLAVVLGFVMWLAYRGSAEEQEVVKKKKDPSSEKSLSVSQRTSIVWGTAVVVCILCYVNVMLPLASSHHVYRGLSASSESDRIYHYDRVARNPYSKDSAFRTIIGRTTQALSSNQEVFMGANRQAVAQQLERLVQYITPFVDNHPREYRVKLVLVDLLNLMTALGSPRAEKAYTYAQDLVGYAPENPFGYLALAQVFINKGDVDGAVRTMETIQSIQPNSSNINSALNYIRGLKEETQ